MCGIRVFERSKPDEASNQLQKIKTQPNNLLPILISFRTEMISRRKILSQSRDDLRAEVAYQHLDDEEDVWYQKEKCFNDHIKEVLEKWGQIDDEIWSKIIVLERNRRVAKAYARTPVLTVNGSDDGFDGFRIGLNGFENPMRDLTTEELKKHIGQGVKIKMDDAGNILVKRVSKCNVYVKATSVEENAIGNDILKLPNHALELDKPLKLFDMKKFQSNVNKEMKKIYPDRKHLEYQSLSVIAFVKSEIEMLQCPIWVLIINIVAIDMLKSKLYPVGRPMDIKNRPKIPIPDEDPYTIAGNGIVLNLPGNNNFQKRADKPPKLPPRENASNQILHKPEYDDLEDNYGFKKNQITARAIRSDASKSKDKKHDDPYYCGLRARVPNFVKMIKIKEGTTKKNQNSPEKQLQLQQHQQNLHPEDHYQQQQQHHHHQQPMFNKFRNDSIPHVTLHHSKSYDQNLELIDNSFNPVYDRLLGSTTKTYLQTQYQKKQMFIGEWD